MEPRDNSIFGFFAAIRGSDLTTHVPRDRPILLSKDGFYPLYAQVDAVREVVTLYGTEFQLQFRVGRVPPQPVTEQPPQDRVTIDVPTDGKLRSESPTFFYTFSSRNSLEENERNLSEFVFSQWEGLDRLQTR
jgi:hypothetical protein